MIRLSATLVVLSLACATLVGCSDRAALARIGLLLGVGSAGYVWEDEHGRERYTSDPPEAYPDDARLWH